jgi:Leucine-rich repeat (LRR) protein
MTGTLPTEIAELASLLVLHLSNNNLNGTAPEEYGSLENLQELFFSNNSLTGSLPLAYTNLKKMITMTIANNYLKGTVPESYCASFEALEELVSDCNEHFSANCTCCTCWIPGLEVGLRS